MLKMFNLRSLRNIGFLLYLFIYLIFPNSAITQNKKVDLSRNLEKALNARDFEFLNQNFKDGENIILTKKFSKIIEEFPNAKWYIKRAKSEKIDQDILQVKVIGKKVIGKEIFLLESNFNYLFSIHENKINTGTLKNLLTTIRNDNNKIDITFSIPDKVLTGTKYDIDIILNDPLSEIIIAGGIKPHQEDSLLKQEINIEPLLTGGIFKMTRAPSKPGTQIWSGVIAHPQGIITFTKSVEIVEKI